VPEIHAETPETALANTRLTDRELLIHAIQHLEVLTDQVGEIHAALEPLRPLLEKAKRRMWLL
jgi:hypothetical protein